MRVELAVAQAGKGGSDGGVDLRGQGLEGGWARRLPMPVGDVAADGGVRAPVSKEAF